MWFADQADDFTTEVESTFRATGSTWGFNSKSVSEGFLNLFAKIPTRILIPAKRRLDLSKMFDVTREPQPDGAGLLDHLHFLKNQLPQTDGARLLRALQDAFLSVTKGYSFETSQDKEGSIYLSFSRDNMLWLSAIDCGLGLQDLLLILFYCHEPSFDLVAIEEPESHLHPDAQRRLLAHIRDETDKQYFLTTHSSVFLDNLYADRVFLTRFEDRVTVSEETSRASMLDDLGYSVADNLVADVVVLVEGPKDVPVVEVFAKKKGLIGKYAIKIWPLGGDIMDQLDLSVMTAAYRTIALLDQDPGSDRIRRRFIEKCESAGIPVVRLSGNAIENYFSVQALRSVFGVQVPSALELLDPKKPVEQQLGFSPKRKNRAIAEHMDLTEIEGTDLGDFFETLGELAAEGAKSQAS